MNEAGGWFAYFRAFKGLPFHPSQVGEQFSRHEAWIDLLDQAAWREINKTVGVRAVLVRRGQILVSVQELAERWLWSWHKVDRFLCLLEDLELIGQSELGAKEITATPRSRKRENNKTIRRRLLTIRNYDAYKDSRRLSGEPTASEHQPGDEATATAGLVTPNRNGGSNERTREQVNKPTRKSREGLSTEDPNREERLARYRDSGIVAGE